MPTTPDNIDPVLSSQSEVVQSTTSFGGVLVPINEAIFSDTINKLGDAFVDGLKTCVDSCIYSDTSAKLTSEMDHDNANYKDAVLIRKYIEGLTKSSLGDTIIDVTEVIQTRLESLVSGISLEDVGNSSLFFQALKTCLIPQIAVTAQSGSYGSPRDKTKNGYKCTYKWSTPEGLIIQSVDRSFRPAFKPDSDINVALFKSSQEDKRTEELCKSLLVSASQSIQELSDALPAEKVTLRNDLKRFGSTIITNSWLESRLKADISNMNKEKAQKGLSGLDDPTALKMVAYWENEGVRGCSEDILTLKYVDSKETPTHLNWFADIEKPSPKAFELSDLLPSKKHRMYLLSHGKVD